MGRFSLFVLLLCSIFNYAQSAPIAIDGKFDDWNSTITTYTDTNETKDGVDLLEFQVTNDAEYLYIKVKANKEFDLTDGSLIPHNFFLYLDTDLDSSTGFRVRDDYGAEIGIAFADRIVFNNFTNTPNDQVRFSDLEFRAAPTVTSNEFEMAIGRNVIPDGVNPLFPSSSVKILIRNIANFDWVPNLNSVFTYTFDETPVPTYTPINFNKTDANFIRVLAYNTKLNSLLDNSKLDEYERIIKAINPDIIGFVESADTTIQYIKSLFDNWLPLGTSEGWFVKKHGGEVTVSKWNIVQEWDLDRQFPVLIDLPERYGTDLLYTNAHLNCCGADDRRQSQVDQYAAFVLDAKSDGGIITLPENTPIVYSGDLNLVGLSNQLTTLLTGQIQNTSIYGAGAPLDWDNTDFKQDDALQTDIRMGYTWRSDGSAFPPGKLDFIIYSDHVLTAEKTYVVQTEVMSNDRLNAVGLQQLDTSTASDHFPVVADFSIQQNTLNITEEKLLAQGIYPNPSTDFITLSFTTRDQYTIEVYNILGSLVISKKVEAKEFVLDINSLASGLFYISVYNTNRQKETFKLIKK
ncbi:T9SS type A sorting domain-containing protein [Tenacibaculum agarivorans]|uniref:T9SS type A sorting domain-containing protein n=1 Tax=Tenacibaculum agarivorans TaxID=1908389 RepID=UPI00094BA33E|nr:T9SS type A sorting domain-containing protein [Tenacibaculum agarivorans]